MESKLQKPGYSGIVEDSLGCQIFGEFGKQYEKWKKTDINSDFVNYFLQSRILDGKNMAIFKALLFFNLPWDVIHTKRAVPRKGFFYPNDDGHELKDLIEE